MIIAGVLEGKGVLLKSGIAGNVELIMEVVGKEEGHAATIGIRLVEQNCRKVIAMGSTSFVTFTYPPLL